MTPVITRTSALLATALLGTAMLAGCSAGSKDAAASASATPTASETASASASPLVSLSPTASSSPTASPTASTSPSPELPAAVIPEGYQSVIARNNQISFAVPASWRLINGVDSTELDDATRTQLEQMASDAGFESLDLLLDELASLDLLLLADAPGESGFTDNINVAESAVMTTVLPNEEEMTSLVSSSGSVPGTYFTRLTPLGEAAVMSYSLTLAGNSNEGAFVIVPVGQGKGYAVITVSAATSDAVATYVDAILASVSLVG